MTHTTHTFPGSANPLRMRRFWHCKKITCCLCSQPSFFHLGSRRRRNQADTERLAWKNNPSQFGVPSYLLRETAPSSLKDLSVCGNERRRLWRQTHTDICTRTNTAHFKWPSRVLHSTFNWKKKKRFKKNHHATLSKVNFSQQPASQSHEEVRS